MKLLITLRGTPDPQVYVLMAWLPTYYEKGLKMDMADHTVLNFLPFLVMFIFSNLSGVAADRLIGKQVRERETTVADRHTRTRLLVRVHA